MATLDVSNNLNTKRKATDDDAPRQAKKTKALSEPLPTFAQAMAKKPDLKWPKHEFTIAHGERSPSDNVIRDLRSRAQQARDRGEQIPTIDVKWSPFFHTLKKTHADLVEHVEELTMDVIKDRNLSRVGDSGLFDRTGSVVREKIIRAIQGMCVYFWMHSVPENMVDRLLVKGLEHLRKDLADMWNAQSRKYLNYILKTILGGVESLSAMYSFKFLSTLSDAQFLQLVGTIFDLDPQAHAMAMFAQIYGGVDLNGIYRDVDAKFDQGKREAFRESIRYRFINCCLVTWKYRVNVEPGKKAVGRAKAVEVWCQMTDSDDTYRAIVKDLGGIDSVPIHSTVFRYRNGEESLFEL